MKLIIDFLLLVIFFVGTSIADSNLVVAGILCISSLAIFSILNKEYMD